MEKQFKEYSAEISIYDLWDVIMRRRKLIAGLFLIAVVASAIITSLAPKVYRGDVVLRLPAVSLISATELTDLVGKIDTDKLDSLLPQSHDAITDVKVDSLKDSKDKVQITIEGTQIDAIQRAVPELVAYINAIDLLKLGVKDEQQRLSKRSSELSSVIDDSAHLVTIYQRLLKDGKLVPVGFNPVDLNQRISDIRMEKYTTDQANQRIKGGVEVARQLYVKRRPVKPSIRKSMALAGTVSLFAGIILAFVLEYVDKKKRQQ